MTSTRSSVIGKPLEEEEPWLRLMLKDDMLQAKTVLQNPVQCAGL